MICLLVAEAKQTKWKDKNGNIVVKEKLQFNLQLLQEK
jgi:hypothetical protein